MRFGVQLGFIGLKTYPQLSVIERKVREGIMKKLIKILSIVLSLVILGCVFAACDQGSNEPTSTPANNEITMTFDYNYDGAPAAFVVKANASGKITEPDDPVREGYEFLGWFTDKAGTEDADFEKSLKASTTVYAAWKQTGIIVKFDLNYAGAATYDTQTIAVGATPTRPANPTRDGYLFTDWYTSATNQTEATEYAFTALNESTTPYAGWTMKTAETCTVTYMWNYEGAPNEGVCETQEVNKNAEVTFMTPTRAAESYRTFTFLGWKDADKNDAGSKMTVTESVTLYAQWHVVNTFDAEYTNLSNFSGNGWSWNRTGTQAVAVDRTNTGEEKANNEAYIDCMNSTGTYIYFEIYSAKEVDNVTLKLRLAIEPYFTNGMALWSDIYTVETCTSKDGPRTVINYDTNYDEGYIYINPISGADLSPFKNYLMTANLHLAKGVNYIYITVTNSFNAVKDVPIYTPLVGHMGAMSAVAPVVDAIIVEYDEGAADVTWTPLVHNIYDAGFSKTDWPCPCPNTEAH